MKNGQKRWVKEIWDLEEGERNEVRKMVQTAKKKKKEKMLKMDCRQA